MIRAALALLIVTAPGCVAIHCDGGALPPERIAVNITIGPRILNACERPGASAAGAAAEEE